MDKKNKDLLKLSKLLEHWSDHNESHKETFLKWRDIAQDYGLENIVNNLNNAIEMLNKSTEFLMKAHKELE